MDQTSPEDYRVPEILRSPPVAILVVAVVYTAGALAGYATTTVPGHIAPIFPSAGVALAAVLILGRRCLLGVLLGSCAANTILYALRVPPPPAAAANLATILPIGVGAMAGAAAGAALVRWFCQNRYPLDSGRDVVVLIAVGAIGCCMISPTIGVLSLWQAGIIPWKLTPYLWLTWWLGDSAGAIAVAPLVLAWLGQRPFERRPRRAWEAATLIAVLLLLCYFVCFRKAPLEYGLVPLLLWAGYRFGMRGASSAAGVVSILATVGTVHGSSAFAGLTINDSLLRLYSFTSVSLIGSLLLAGVFTERNQAEDAVRASEERYRRIARCVPDLIWTMDLSGRFTYANPALQRTHGWTLAEFEHLTLQDTESPEEAAKHTGIIAEELKLAEDPGYDRNKVYTLETEQVRKDGSTFQAEVSASFLWSEDGKPVGIIGITRDITERKQAETSLRKSEERFRRLFEKAPVAIRISRVDLTLFVNQKHLDLYGFQNPDELVGRPVYDLWAPESRELVRDYAHRRARGELVPTEYEGVGLRKDGTQFVVHIAVVRVELPDGPASLAFLTDITERKRAEEAVSEARQLYEGIFKASPAAIVLSTEADGRFLTVNSAHERMIGLRADEVLGHTAGELQSWENPDDRVRVVQRLKEEGGVLNMDFAFRRKSGERFPGLISMVPVVVKGERCILSVLTDITDRKRAEEELRRLKNYLANIIDSMPSILVGMDNQETITQWSKQAERATGIPAEQAIGRPLRALLPDFSPWIESLRAEIQQRRPASLEKVLLSQGQDRHFYDLVLYPLVTNGVEGTVVRIEDVTERTRIQELMVQTEKMLSVGGLAAGMAHEINNPLGIISQAAQNIERRISSELPANRQIAEQLALSLESVQAYLAKREIPQFLQDVREASSRAAKIVSNMLQFSRKSESAHQSASLADVLERTLELAASDYDLKKRYDFRSIEIVREYDPDLPAVPIVVVEMEQVFLNLVRNASQAMADNPPERKPRITLRLKREERYALVEVEDNGPGMAESIQRRVFEPFFTTKQPGIGTGLGLSVSYMIVTQNHKGLIGVQSTPGLGTLFSIRLPFA